jgi:hypothetical protein
VRRDVGDEMSRLLPLFLGLKRVPGTRVLAGGRGVTLSAPVRDGVRAVLRRNLRGGLPARFVRDLYLGWGARPFAEVEAGERLRAMGLPVPETLGALARRVAFLFYRGAVATREVERSANLWVYLEETADAAARRRACAAAGEVVRALHDAGAMHPDLNLQNFLVQPDPRDGAAVPRIWLIDCDGVRFTSVGAAERRRARERLARSCRRLDPEGAVVDPAWFEV